MKLNFRLLITFLFSIFSFIYLGIHKESKSSKSFHIKYNQSHAPYVATFFNDIPLTCLIDTGSNGGIDLHRKVISRLNELTFEGTSSCKYSSDEVLEANLYRVKNIKFLDLQTKNSIVTELPNDYEKVTSSFTNTYNPNDSAWNKLHSQFIDVEEDEAVIGSAFLKAFNFLLDFQNHKFKIYRKGKLPFFTHPSLFFAKKIRLQKVDDQSFVCEINTNKGLKLFLLDTASTVNRLFTKDENEACKTLTLKLSAENLSLSDHLFHSKKKLSDHTFDGVLGAEFFYNKVLFFDMDKNEIYFLSH